MSSATSLTDLAPSHQQKEAASGPQRIASITQPTGGGEWSLRPAALARPDAIENGNPAINLLAVMPQDEDHETLQHMLPTARWTLHKAHAVSSALAHLRKGKRIHLIICEQDLGRDTWLEMLKYTLGMNPQPLLIVASRLADERLWAEALNRGAFDVLAKPFDAHEVNHVLNLGWLRWRRHQDRGPAEITRACGA
jgi:CheY-like chemotaxis protein